MWRIVWVLCAAVVLTRGASSAEEPPRVAVAWFTDAAVDESVKVEAPDPALPAAKGGWGAAVQLTKAVPVEDPVLTQRQGYISFWIRPDWDGNDGKVHRLLRVGDPEKNGLLIEKSAKNMLRYVMASPGKVTVARADVSGWKAGEWHHVAIAWITNHDGIPMGLPLWIDKWAMDGPIASGNTFLDPATMDDARLWIGDETSEAAMDELVMHPEPKTEKEGAPIELVYRDYFRTAPYTGIAVDAEPHAVPSDRRVVRGAHKQFGLQGQLNGRWERMTEFVGEYSNWTYFDAKPFITWSTSDETIATVDENGLVKGHARGRCMLTAQFHGLTATYSVQVIPVEQPDLDLYVVERQPRYKEMALKNAPAPGDVVKSVARIANFGYEPTPVRVPVTFELIPDTNGNYRLDANERAVLREQATIPHRLHPLEETTVEFEWTWPEEPVWVRVTVDARNRVGEICEANNQIVELNAAKPVIWGYVADVLKHDHAERHINLTGSFSYYDWMRTQSERVRLMLREAVYPTTSPVGVLDDIRVDEFLAYDPDHSEGGPFDVHREYHDGGFPLGDKNSDHFLQVICSGLVHELGHTMLSLPDLYGHPCLARNVFVTDENGERYAGGPLLPEVTKWGGIMGSPGEAQVECYTGYSPLMVYCHMWLHPAHAGQVQHYRGIRGPRFWGIHGLLIPTSRHELLVLDANDEPLTGAAVYCYHTTNVDAEDSSAKFFADRPKYMGHTNAGGRYEFPGQTDENWDSPETDEADGAIDAWNPFGLKTKDTAFTPNCFGAEGMMLLRIVSGGQTEFHWLTLTMMNEEFFKGAKNWGVYTIRTSLTSTEGETPLVRREVPETIRTTNLKPAAKIDIEPAEADAQPELTVKAGDRIRIDGSASFDPEGQPLVYRWHAQGPFGPEGGFSDKPVYEGHAPTEETGDFMILFYVIDGVRVSDTIRVKLHVVADDSDAVESADVE
ncbi:MAG: Ig-like domain-containing protein [Verrucomicrobia bacterium]|nr:Ig-like domain-containing protein [Verrucomicrobiota bacterium]